jgi:hypothetical protein
MVGAPRRDVKKPRAAKRVPYILDVEEIGRLRAALNVHEAGFNQNSYCAWHDFTTSRSYPGVTAGMAFVNMPYVLNAGGGSITAPGSTTRVGRSATSARGWEMGCRSQARRST